MTASVLQGEREKCLAAGMDDYLAKPFTLIELKEILTKHLTADLIESSDRKTSTLTDILREIIEPQTFQRLLQVKDESDKVFLNELVEIYFTHSADLLKKLRECLAEENFSSFKQAAHGLKGSSASLGLLEMSELCVGLEIEAETTDLQKVAKKLAEVESEFERMRQLVANFITIN
jgi:two-component system, sensor histidine kinase and response regulator